MAHVEWLVRLTGGTLTHPLLPGLIPHAMDLSDGRDWLSPPHCSVLDDPLTPMPKAHLPKNMRLCYTCQKEFASVSYPGHPGRVNGGSVRRLGQRGELQNCELHRTRGQSALCSERMRWLPGSCPSPRLLTHLPQDKCWFRLQSECEQALSCTAGRHG